MTITPIILRAGVSPLILRTENVLGVVYKEDVIIVRPGATIVEQEVVEPVILRLGSITKIIDVGQPLIFRALLGHESHNHDDRYYTESEINALLDDFAPDLTPIYDALAFKASLVELAAEITALIGGAPADANTLKKLNDKILGIQTILNSDNIDLDNVQELVDAIETIQTSLSTILVNDLTTGGVTKALTAEQGKVLKGLIDGKALSIHTHAISDVTALQDALDARVTKDWWHYIGSTKFQDTTVTLAGGDALTYNYTPTDTTVYRYITTALTGLYPTTDAFYATFDGVTLSDLIVTR